VLAFSELSATELAMLRNSENFPFDVQASSKYTATIKCKRETAKKLAKIVGGTYKIARVCGDRLEDLENCIQYPEETKFYWTVSGYCCSADDVQNVRDFVSDLLKKESLGKSKFMPPNVGDGNYELKIKDLRSSVFGRSGRAAGLDAIIDLCSGGTRFGFTEFLSDVDGFEERDMSRPYQDPTITLSPRIARALVNLCGLRPKMTILDPFCGVGTILQEALLLGFNAIGVEISSAEVSRCRENLDWTRSRFQVSPTVISRIVRADTMDLQRSDIPHVDAIATEPILAPKLEKNPPSETANRIVQGISEKYSFAFRAFSGILDRGAPVSIVAPVLIDDRGKSHEMDLFAVGKEFDFNPVRSDKSKFQNPCLVPTNKKKIIQRKVFLMKHG